MAPQHRGEPTCYDQTADTDGTCDLESTQCSQVHASKHGLPPQVGPFLGLRVELPQLVDFLARREIALELVRSTGLIFRGSRAAGRVPGDPGGVLGVKTEQRFRSHVGSTQRPGHCGGR